MIRAYSELYLDDAKDRLSIYFDYMVNDCLFDGDWSAKLFLASGYADKFECGDPAVLSGMSGIELARKVIHSTYAERILPEYRYSDGYSPEYWAGWALAWYQWQSGRRFRDIFEAVSFSEIVRMYPVFHEMDITEFSDTMESRIASASFPSRLKALRESRGLSQSELASASGVNLRSIQLYEQGVNDIDKAQVITLYRLSRIIGCRVEDLMQNPRM